MPKYASDVGYSNFMTGFCSCIIYFVAVNRYSVDGWMDGRTDGRRDERMDGRKDGQMEGRTEGRTDGWMDMDSVRDAHFKAQIPTQHSEI